MHREKVLVFDSQHQYTELSSSCVSRPRYGVEDANGQFWLAEGKEDKRDFRKIDTNGNCDLIKVNSPYASDIRDIIVQNGEVWIASGGTNSSAVPNSNIDGTYSLIDGQWSVYNKFTIPSQDSRFNIDDHFVVRMHPENNTVYMGTYHKGLIEYDRESESFTLYDDNTSQLEQGNQTPDVRVAGLAFDAEK